MKGLLELVIFLIDQTAQLLAVLAEWTAYILEHSKPAIEFFTGALKSIGDMIQFVISKFNAMRDAARAAFNAARDAATSIPGVGGVLNAVLPGRASGGPVSGGQPYIVGERGPEVFVPRGSGTIIPNGGGAMQVTVMEGANITVRSEADIQAIANRVSTELARTLQGQRNGLATAM